ncbi:MAG: Fe-S protein assembly co-chaperone HscB [Gammaproteobacteria bacterium]|nr:Fe-S protein assembly co-chaperone HscB [Gammaproteobacteria bacterium]MDH3559674.1 Fe-S protein assembly co-chaperone HscB [Gammaproteobacteria bacterium]
MAVDLSSTYFDLFALPQSFQLDLELLDSRYRELQSTVHPDRFVNATDQERRLSMQLATRVNEGYRTLKDPLKRGRYLLELDGYSFDDEQHTTSDSAFLMEQMELREALAEVRAADDPYSRLAGIMDRIAADFDGLTGELQERLGSADKGGTRAAADTLMKMQFFRRLNEEAQELEAALEDELD